MGVKFTLVRFLLVGDDFAFAFCFSPTKGSRGGRDAATVRYVLLCKIFQRNVKHLQVSIS